LSARIGTTPALAFVSRQVVMTGAASRLEATPIKGRRVLTNLVDHQFRQILSSP
jgi:hypothetical protein